MTSDMGGSGLRAVAVHGQLGKDGRASGGTTVGTSVAPMSPQCGNSVRLADGRQGGIRAVLLRGVLEVAGPFGTVFTHVDVVERT